MKTQPSETLDYAEFAVKFLQLRYDIALAPLVDSTFNWGKSAVKYLEYTAQGTAGIYSTVGPYLDVVRDGETGLLAGDLEAWEFQLRRLIEDSELRRRISEQAQADVRQNWLLSEHAHSWREAFETLSPRHEKKKVFSGFVNSIYDQVSAYQQNQEQQLDQLTNKIAEKQQMLAATVSRLNEIERSRAWKFVQLLWRFRVAMRGKRSGTAVEPSATKPTAVNTELSAIKIIAPSPVDQPQLWQKRSNHFDVILFPVMDWASRVQRPQQIAWQFAQTGHRVFYIHPDFRQDGQLIVKLIEENIFEIHLPAASQVNIYQEAMPDDLARLLLPCFGKLRSTFGIMGAISMVDLPFWTPLALGLRQRFAWKIVYDCMDYHRGFSTNADPMLDLEDNLIRESDLIVVASYPMRDLLASINSQIILAPNGADFNHFRFGDFSTPTELSTLSRPIIGYFGAISDWFDAELVRDIAQSRPDWNFVLIGSTLYGNETVLRSQSNIHLLGEKPYAELPAYLHAFDVAIIPLKKTPLTQLANQLKLFEYLSAGKPVVSADLQDMYHYTHHAYLASSLTEWLSGIENALAKDTYQLIRERREFAIQNTWRQRLIDIQKAISAIYPLVSIIINDVADVDTLQLCLQSIFNKTDFPAYEVLLSSNEANSKYLWDQKKYCLNVKLTDNPIDLASGDFFVFLDSRSVVTYGWLTNIMRYLRDSRIGLIAPTTNTSGVPVDYPSLQYLDRFAAGRSVRYFGEIQQITEIPNVCFAMKRDIYMAHADNLLHGLTSQNLDLVRAQDIFVHHWV